jgi:site-specific recombinase XerD
VIAINRFFKYIERQNRKFHNPIVFRELNLVFPKKDRGYYSVLSRSEAEKLLKQPDKRTAMGCRDRAIIYLMLVYGLRVNEVTKLRYKNLDSQRIKGQQKLWVLDRKGSFRNRPKTAIILNSKALLAFDAWLEVVQNSGIKTTRETPIFLPFIYDRSLQGLVIKRTKEYRPMSTMALENTVNKYMKKAKIDREGEVLSAHSLRHTAFTMLAQAGRPIQDIQKLAGHSDISTTMIYVHSVQSYEDHAGLHSPLNK